MRRENFVQTYVVIPRGSFDKWVHCPWSAVLAAAERKEDGLRVYLATEEKYPYPPRSRLIDSETGDLAAGWDDWNSIAFLKAADRHWRATDKTLLDQQNW